MSGNRAEFLSLAPTWGGAAGRAAFGAGDGPLGTQGIDSMLPAGARRANLEAADAPPAGHLRLRLVYEFSDARPEGAPRFELTYSKRF